VDFPVGLKPVAAADQIQEEGKKTASTSESRKREREREAVFPFVVLPRFRFMFENLHQQYWLLT